MGARLLDFWQAWDGRNLDKWTIQTLRFGYKIQFSHEPTLLTSPLSMGAYQKGSDRYVALDKLVAQMLEKRATVIVSDKSSPGYYSRMFVVPKSTGGWRPIIDLSPLNKSIPAPHFKMETPQSIRASLRQGDWLTSIDLRDAYFHIPIHASSQRYLRFVWEEQVYQFRALCFGLSTAPLVFTRIFQAISILAHRSGIRLYRYLDDWLIAAESRGQSSKATQVILNLCLELGLLVNFEKSDLVPSRRALYLGMDFNMESFTVRPSTDRLSRFNALLRLFFLEDRLSALMFLKLIGHMVSLEKLIPLARIRIRPVQFHLADSWNPAMDYSLPVPISADLRLDLNWWALESNLMSGQKIMEHPPEFLLFTDASRQGWGAHLRDLEAQGLWSTSDRLYHINVLELRAVFLGLQAFLQAVQGSSVVARTDNTTVVAYIRNQGGTRSRLLTAVTREILDCMFRVGSTRGQINSAEPTSFSPQNGPSTPSYASRSRGCGDSQ